MTRHPLSRRIADVLALAPDSPAIEFDDAWWSWGQVDAAARRIAHLAEQHGGTQTAVLLRNSPTHVATVLGLLLADATVVVVNPARGDDRTRADLAALAPALAIGTPDDVATLLAPSERTTVATITTLAEAPAVSTIGRGTPDPKPGVAVRMLTSGTTGPPKRIDLTYDMLARSTLGDMPSAPRRGVAIVNAPLVHIGGVYRVLQCVTAARPFALLPRFDLDRWSEVVRRHRPKAVSLVPAALRMVLHSGLTREDLASIRVVTSGTAPLSADDADAFTEKFGIPVLTSYAATEFGGGVAGWTLADHERHWRAKRGSVGRATLGAGLRVVTERGDPVPPGEAGLLEVKPGQLGPGTEWLRTTDLARLDADGFLWILGRADQAIIRGGFKVMPDDVRSALEAHAAVAGAAVVGRPDERLGETPVAMVELRAPITADELADHLRARLAHYEVPASIAVVDAIPRTPSGKPDLTAVRAHFADDLGGGRGG
ncbi:class I adenylate-forming enzyme family protein [Mycolicibacterium sp. GCM10028919]|uniref:class I adenylate-forming enzyme family protein n=1 Tax=Mycolicibacterium sp. GCM10028919 TaxID=3273401 RepID=UPI0036089B63